jgi:hypothetical protein
MDFGEEVKNFFRMALPRTLFGPLQKQFTDPR